MKIVKKILMILLELLTISACNYINNENPIEKQKEQEAALDEEKVKKKSQQI